MAEDPIAGRSSGPRYDAVIAEAHRVAADIRRRAERDAQRIRSDAAEWAATTRRQAEEHRDRVVAEADQAAGAAEPEPAPEAVADPEPADAPTPGPPPSPAPEVGEEDTSAFVPSSLAKHRRRRVRTAGAVLVALVAVIAGAALITSNLPDDDSASDGGTPASSVTDLVPLPADAPGRSLTDVLAELDRAGVVGEVERVFDEDVPAGDVVALDAPGARVPRGSTVALVVSRGPEPRPVPRIEAGADAAEAEAALEAEGFLVEREDVFHETALAGAVLELSPDPGTIADRGSAVRLTVSKGPDVVVVPDLLGRTLEEAAAALERADLAVGQVHGPDQGVIRDQNPDGGARARRGATVNLRRAP